MDLRASGFRNSWVLPGALVFLAALLIAGCSGLQPIKEEAEAPYNAQPNIILIVTDDLDYALAQRMDGLGSLMREEGVSFGNAFVSYPLCCPARATVLTGLYAHNHGVWGNRPPNGGFETFREEGNEESTIAVRLQEGGYQTALFGKYLNLYPDGDPTYVPPGWDKWHASVSSSTSYYDYELNENGAVVSYGQGTRGLPDRRSLRQGRGLRPAGGVRCGRETLLRLPGTAGAAPARDPGEAPPGDVRRRGCPSPSLLRRGGRLGQAAVDEEYKPPP